MNTLIRGIDFGPVWSASGAQGFFSKFEYLYARAIPDSWYGATFVAKTMTVETRLSPEEGKGNMRLRADGITPVAWHPDCIVVSFRHKASLNAVGLSNAGATNLLARNRWQKRREPFFLSYAPMGNTPEDKFRDAERFSRILQYYLPSFQASVGLQVNLSCPNTGEAYTNLVEEAHMILRLLSPLGIPLVVKLSATVPVLVGIAIAESSHCDGLSVSNTIPWDALTPLARWTIFGNAESPLVARGYGAGGYTGPILLSMAECWVREARSVHGWEGYINAGGGIRRPHDVDELFVAGANSVSVGSASMQLIPFRVRNIIQRAQQLFKEKQS